MYRVTRVYRKIPDSFQGGFEFLLKSVHLKQFLSVLRLISWSLPDVEGGITCMVGAKTQKFSFSFQALKNSTVSMPLGPTGQHI